MNWTGGTLSRSRNINAKASLSNQQKKYFAKARIKQQSGQRKSPPEIQYFDFGEWKPESSVRDRRPSDPVKERVSSQRTLDQYQNVQGVVRKLKSLRPKDEGSKRKRSVINDAEGSVLPSGIPIPPISPTTTGSYPAASPSPTQAEPTKNRVVGQFRTSTSSTSDDLFPLAALDSVETKRIRLLQQSDWVGIEKHRRLSKPLKMNFTNAQDRDLIGRRRPLKGSAAQNRWNVQGPRPVKVPLMEPGGEKRDDWGPDEMSIRIGSTATTKGPVIDEMLDCYQSPRLANCSALSAQSHENKSMRHTPRSQHWGPEAAKREVSEPFRSLFSPEEIEQSGVAQLVEASTVTDDSNLSFTGDELQLPEDYELPGSEREFRLDFDEQIPRHRDQASGFDHRNARIEEAIPSTSPLSMTTSRYMRELGDQSFPDVVPKAFAKGAADRAASPRAGPIPERNPAEEDQEANTNPEQEVPVQNEVAKDEQNTQPTEDEDEIWRNFIDLDATQNPQSSHITAPDLPPPIAKAPPQTHHPPSQPPSTPPPAPVPAADDDELIWQNFIFGSPTPDHEPSDPPPTQPSMVAEAATSPLKRNPHLPLDQLFDASSPVLTHASRFAHASSTSSVEIPSTIVEASLSYDRPSSPPTFIQAIPSGPNPHPTTTISTSTPSSLQAVAPSSPAPSPGIIPSHNPIPNTPSPLASRQKITFKKPTRYTGPKPTAPAKPVQRLGRKIGKSRQNGKGRKKQSSTLSEAAERAERQMKEDEEEGTGFKRRKENKKENSGDESKVEETDNDDDNDDDEIVDDD